MFVDRAKIYIRSGKGGDGAVTVAAQAFHGVVEALCIRGAGV